MSDRRWLARCLGNTVASPLDSDDLDAILAVSHSRSILSGHSVFCRDDPVRDVFILETGKIALSRRQTDRSPLLHILHPGEIFGDVGLFLQAPEPVDAVALEDSTVLRIAGPDFAQLVTSRPRFALRWMVSMAQRLADAQDRLEELLSGPIDLQLASFLHHAADEHGMVNTSQDTLARLLGARRPSISRSLGHLEKRGFIERQYGHVQITDSAGLRALTAS